MPASPMKRLLHTSALVAPLLAGCYTPYQLAGTNTNQCMQIPWEVSPIPAGTRVVMDMTWDNSAQNPANPDPNKTVRWGDQTWEEMNVGWFRYRAATEEDRARALADGAAHTASSGDKARAN